MRSREISYEPAVKAAVPVSRIEGRLAEAKRPSLGAVGPTLPRGLIPRVEWSREQVSFIRDAPRPLTVMVDLHTVDRLVGRGLDAMCFGDGVEVVTTSTIADETLALYRVEREIDLVRRFRPRWHVAGDRPVYLTDDSKSRRLKIDFAVEAYSDLRDAVATSGVVPIALIKGVNEAEWRHSVASYRTAGASAFAYYGAQYFGHGRGRHQAELVMDVRSIVAGSGIPYLMLIGLQSPNLIGRFPEQVQAFAGMRWRSVVRPGRAPAGVTLARFESWNAAWRKAAKTRQGILWDAQE